MKNTILIFALLLNSCGGCGLPTPPKKPLAKTAREFGLGSRVYTFETEYLAQEAQQTIDDEYGFPMEGTYAGSPKEGEINGLIHIPAKTEHYAPVLSNKQKFGIVADENTIPVLAKSAHLTAAIKTTEVVDENWFLVPKE